MAHYLESVPRRANLPARVVGLRRYRARGLIQMNETVHSDSTASGLRLSSPPSASTAQTISFAVATATIVLPLFAPQPLVGIIGASFGLSSWEINAAATMTLFGYATGLFLLTPLTDLREARRVILTTVTADVLALAAAAAARSTLSGLRPAAD